MGAIEQASTTDQDYRSTHVDKGARYDASLAQSPFDHYMAAWEARHLPSLVHRFFPKGVGRYLDFACGTGRITAQLAPMATQSVGVDISPTMLEEARRKCPATQFHLADLTQQSLDLGRFDLVSSFRFFGNAQDELREGALRAIVPRLADDGLLLINSHRNPRALYAVLNRLTGGDDEGMDLHLPKLRGLLARHRLEIVALQPIGAWMWRTKLMVSTRPDDPVAMARESRFGGAAWAGLAPDVVVMARRRR